MIISLFMQRIKSWRSVTVFPEVNKRTIDIPIPIMIRVVFGNQVICRSDRQWKPIFIQ